MIKDETKNRIYKIINNLSAIKNTRHVYDFARSNSVVFYPNKVSLQNILDFENYAFYNKFYVADNNEYMNWRVPWDGINAQAQSSTPSNRWATKGSAATPLDRDEKDKPFEEK